jgi:hypothetical protein
MSFELKLPDIKLSKQKTIALVAIAVLVALYIVTSLFFSSHFLPGTTVNGINATLRSPKALASDSQKRSDEYSTHVTGDGFDLTITKDEVSLAFDTFAYENEAKSYLPGWAWPVKLAQPREFVVTSATTFDKNAVKKLIGPTLETVNADGIPTAPAGIEYDEDQKAFVAVEEQRGTLVDLDLALDTICMGIATLRESIELGSESIVQPSLVLDNPNFDDAVARANEVSGLALTFTVQGQKVATTNASLIRSWITLNDDCEVTGDLGAITAWAQKDLSSIVDTVGTSRTFVRPDDQKEVTVFGGTYGWNVDGAELAKVIQSHIENNESASIEVPMQSTGTVYAHGTPDWGPVYVDVDLGQQYVRLYDDNGDLALITECVTGNLAEGQETITGVFALEGKESPAKLIGLDNDMDGEPDYETDVDFWMPFYGGYGLHDALWRASFGGDEFQYNGSHGCVNLPYNSAAIIYETIDVGDPVVVHW